jgi:hypothetical protein
MIVGMKLTKMAILFGAAAATSGCVAFEGVRPSRGGANEVRAIAEDRGRDSGSLSALEAGIYIDPDGCHIWMIDDGVEGYWSRRLDPVSGLPVCTEVAPPNSIVGEISFDPGIRDWVPRPSSR